MQDWQLSETGDILFYEDNSEKNNLKLSFYISKNKNIRLAFRIRKSTPIVPDSNNNLKLSFNVTNIQKEFNIISLDGYGSFLQALRIRIMTSLSDIKDRENIGSKLELTRHINLVDENNKAKVINYIKEAIEDIAPNPSISLQEYHGFNRNITFGYKVTIKINGINYELEV